MKLKEDPKLIARCAIDFLKICPCAICKYEDTSKTVCFQGYKKHGSCPVYKILKKEFEKIGGE